MSSLEDDIARVAALRGRKGDTQALIEEAEHLKRRVAWADVDMLFQAPESAHTDMDAYDELPQPLRDCFREAPTLKPMNATAALRLIQRGVPVDSIIKAVQHRLNATPERR